MSLNLNTQPSNKVLQTNRKYKTPKSVRLKKIELQQLEEFKNRIKEITSSEYCSDTQAFKILLTLSKHSTKTLIKKALSETL